MDSDRFWKMIDEARSGTEDLEEMRCVLTANLTALRLEEILRWLNIFRAYQNLSYKNKLWAAAYVMNGGASDDGFDYFRAWLTAQGKDVFMAALADPDSLASIEIEPDEAEDEEMLYVGIAAYCANTSAKEPDYDVLDTHCALYALSDAEMAELAHGIPYSADIDATWEEDNVEAQVPRLAARFFT
ncbi:MAG: DUF4240 domain-containing protein [Stenotrophomonas bentonitica]|jgi:hypothetical protein